MAGGAGRGIVASVGRGGTAEGAGGGRLGRGRLKKLLGVGLLLP